MASLAAATLTLADWTSKLAWAASSSACLVAESLLLALEVLPCEVELGLGAGEVGLLAGDGVAGGGDVVLGVLDLDEGALELDELGLDVDLGVLDADLDGLDLRLGGLDAGLLGADLDDGLLDLGDGAVDLGLGDQQRGLLLLDRQQLLAVVQPGDHIAVGHLVAELEVDLGDAASDLGRDGEGAVGLQRAGERADVADGADRRALQQHRDGRRGALRLGLTAGQHLDKAEDNQQRQDDGADDGNQREDLFHGLLGRESLERGYGFSRGRGNLARLSISVKSGRAVGHRPKVPCLAGIVRCAYSN